MAGHRGGADAQYVHGETSGWKGGCTGLKVQPRRTGSDGREVQEIAGHCPVCGHSITKQILALRTGELFAPSGQQKVPELPTATYVVTCNCVFAHEGAPEGVRGCGAEGAVLVTPTPNGLGTVEYREAGADERDADEWVERAGHEQLPRMREFAGQWATMLGIVSGLIAVGTIFGADEKIYGLTGGAAVAYVVLAAGSLAVAVLAVLLASQAAGLRKLDDIPADVDGRVRLTSTLVRYCRLRLTLSKLAALISIVLLAVAMYLRFFG